MILLYALIQNTKKLLKTYFEHASDASRVASDDVEKQTTAVLDCRLERDVARAPLGHLRVVVGDAAFAEGRDGDVFAPRRRAARAAQEDVAMPCWRVCDGAHRVVV